MQTLDVKKGAFFGRPLWWRIASAGWRQGVFLEFVVAALLLTGCKKDPAMAAIESDANGYICLNYGAKYVTARSVFMGPNCPKCKDQTVVDVVGYLCDKDKHLTIRASRKDPVGPVCEQCQANVVNSMFMPKEKDLKAWGATPPPP